MKTRDLPQAMFTIGKDEGYALDHRLKNRVGDDMVKHFEYISEWQVPIPKHDDEQAKEDE